MLSTVYVFILKYRFCPVKYLIRSSTDQKKMDTLFQKSVHFPDYSKLICQTKPY